MPKPIAFEDFVRNARLVHGDRYDYSRARDRWHGTNSKIPILCPDHGPFEQQPRNHCRGNGCPTCGLARIKHASLHNPGTISALLRARGHPYELRGDSYRARNLTANWHCPIHGVEFDAPLDSLLRPGSYGCPSCREDTLRARRIADRHDPRADANCARIAAELGAGDADLYRSWIDGDRLVDIARRRQYTESRLSRHLAKLCKLAIAWNASAT